MKTVRRALLAWLACASCAVAPLAAAQGSFPDKPLRMIVPFAPGGASDAVARPLAQALGELLGQPVVVENKAGAAGNLGLEFAARAPADGHTLLLGNMSTNAMNATSYAHVLKINPGKDLAAVGIVGYTPSVLVASTAFAPRTAAELVAHAKANPGRVNYWLPGVASGPHFDIVQLEKAAGIRMTGVPFSGGAGPGMTALIGGQVDIGLVNAIGAVQQIKTGRLKGLMVSTPQRLPELPDVPTAAEAGFPNVLNNQWQGLFVPAATPRPVLLKLHAALADALSRPQVRDAMARLGVVLTPSATPEQAQAYVDTEAARWARIIGETGVKAE